MDERYSQAEAQQVAQQRSLATPERYFFVAVEAGVSTILSSATRYPYVVRCANVVAAYHAGTTHQL